MEITFPAKPDEPGCLVSLTSDPERVGITLDATKRRGRRTYRLVRFANRPKQFIPEQILQVATSCDAATEQMQREFCLARYGLYRKPEDQWMTLAYREPAPRGPAAVAGPADRRLNA